MSEGSDIFDQSVINQIMLQRFVNSDVGKKVSSAESFDLRLSQMIRRYLRSDMSVRDKPFLDLLAQIKTLRREMIQELNFSLRESVEGVAAAEHDKEWLLLLGTLSLTSSKPTRPSRREITEVPFSSGASSASTLSEWLSDLLAADFRKIKAALTLGQTQQMSVDEVVAHVIGTKKNSFRDGVVARTRNNIRALVTTAIFHAAQQVRESLWVLIPEVAGMLWISILDEKTSVICRGHDNGVVMFNLSSERPAGTHLLSPPGARPPAHPNCRSRMIAVLRGASAITRVTFSQWLTGRSDTVQNRILGNAKAEMFRQGVPLNDFTDIFSRELTIEQLVAA